MPRRKTSLKAQRKDKKRRLHNLRIKREIKKAIKKFSAYIQTKNSAEARTLLPSVFSKLDKATKKNVIKKNNAARKKSRLSRMLSKITQPEK
ncbi:30S ribosomal protein S20 [Candidatus Omnitrophota bacterium]